MRAKRSARSIALLLVGTAAGSSARAAEHVTLRNGFAVDCTRQETVGDRVRLYLPGAATTENYLEVNASQILRTEMVADAPVIAEPAAPAKDVPSPVAAGPLHEEPTADEMRQMLTHAGEKHNVDADLLASVVKAESGGRVHAVSHAGAQGLMQLMPGTAAQLGVTDAFAAEQNIGGGSAYLDQLLTRYHDNMALALAAYNAGPAAVDRYRGVPPFAETRTYVARVIREFNRRKRAAMLAAAR